MTLYDFLQLDEMEQAEVFWDATMIADRTEGEHKLILYQKHSFYIEVWYHIENNDIEKIRSFANTDQLEPYLIQIDISKLNK